MEEAGLIPGRHQDRETEDTLLLVQCNSCGATGFTEDHGFPDAAAACTSAADDPPGSPEGSCCADHESLEHHLDHVRRTGDASCRPVTITIPPGGVTVTGPAG